MFSSKAILSFLAALSAFVSATAYYATNENAGSAQEFQQTRVHGAPGPEMGVAGIPAALAAAYGLYLVARRRKQQ